MEEGNLSKNDIFKNLQISQETIEQIEKALSNEFKKIEENKKEIKDKEQKLKEKEEELKIQEEKVKKREKEVSQKEENLLLREKIAYKNSESKELRIKTLNNKIIELKEKISENDILNVKKLEQLQEKLVGNSNNYKLNRNKIQCPFKYKFGTKMDNKTFISFIDKGLDTLYSGQKKLKEKAINFFINIKKQIPELIYLPMINNNSLCQFKKHIYLSLLTSQLDEDDYNSLLEYIFYTDSYFNEQDFKEIVLEIKRDDAFIELFTNYKSDCQLKLNFNILEKYIFSKPIIDAYLETCKAIFGKDATFVSEENIPKALKDIYEQVVKKMKFIKMEEGYLGVTIYSKKIFITNLFVKNIYGENDDQKKMTYLVGLILTILHEISHCLTNCLPLYSNDYEELSNPFIRTWKKNVKIYNLVVGNEDYEESKNVNDILQEKIPNYKIIKDSGFLFESILFENMTNYKYNYLIAEYFLNMDNLDQSLADFKNNYNLFVQKFNTSQNLKKINENSSVLFNKYSDCCFFGKCLLDLPIKFMD
jgi:hypothetical protein